MILVDTSVWVDHLRVGNEALAGLLNAGMVLVHPFVVGELALGDLRQRVLVLDALSDLPRASVATDAEVLQVIDPTVSLGAASAISMSSARCGSADRRSGVMDLRQTTLRGVAEQLGLAMLRPKR